MSNADRRILVVGSGAREHALARAFFLSDSVEEVFVAPGNPGMENATCVEIQSQDFARLIAFASEMKIDLTVVGGEEPLVAGIRDAFDAAGLKLFGPTKRAALLEGSKSFAKNLMEHRGIPTARGRVFTDFHDAREELYTNVPFPIVIKKSGPARGKGVHIVHSAKEGEEIVRSMFAVGRRDLWGQVIFEQYLEGSELSVFALVNGSSYCWFGEARDYKRAYDGNKGPMTGGMGAFSPVPMREHLRTVIERRILVPTLEGLMEINSPYQGFLYLGLMLTDDGPKVLEYNCRLGDPEAQVLLPRLQADFGDLLIDNDFAELLLGILEGNVPKEVDFVPDTAVGVVLASEGYPERPVDGRPIGTLEHAEEMGALVFTGGVAREQDNLVTRGGRICTVVGLGADLTEARRKAYAGIAQIDVAGAFFRRDIGHKR